MNKNIIEMVDNLMEFKYKIESICNFYADDMFYYQDKYPNIDGILCETKKHINVLIEMIILNELNDIPNIKNEFYCYINKNIRRRFVGDYIHDIKSIINNTLNKIYDIIDDMKVKI